MPHADDALANALERLYAAPLEDFMRVRKELAAELKAAGDAAAARRLAEAHKPPRTTWALNQATRRHPDLVRAFVEARARAEAAQREARGAESLRGALEAYRASLADVVNAAAEVLGGASGPERRRIAETLEAAGADDAFLHARLIGGRLEARAAIADPIAALTGAGAEAPPRAKAKAKHDDAKKRRSDEKARAREEARAAKARALEERRAKQASKKEIAALEAALRKAKAKDAAARTRLRAAQAEADGAARKVEELAATLERARR